MTDETRQISRRSALKCLAYGGAGTLFTLSGGVLAPLDLARAAQPGAPAVGRPLFLQISDTHIGFSKEANPDVTATLMQTIALANGMAQPPALTLHTGDITHLSKPAEFDLAQQMLSGLHAGDLHTVPGEHDTTDPAASEYFSRFGKMSDNRGYYSFDHGGVHFLGLVNVLQFKPGGLGTLGAEQLAWASADLKARSASTPIVVFAHMPLWTIYEPWGWGTDDAAPLMDAVAPLRLRHGAQWAHPSDRAEGGRQPHVSHRPLHGLPATGPGRGRRTGPAQGACGSAGFDARTYERRARPASRNAHPERPHARLAAASGRSSARPP